jgi:hypothetical protein
LKNQYLTPTIVLRLRNETFRRNYEGDVAFIQFENETIHATGGHPIWVLQGEELEHRPLCDCLPSTEQNITPQGRWVYARDLQVNDIIQSRAHGSRKVFGLTIEITETLVYNFSLIIYITTRLVKMKFSFIIRIVREQKR